MCGFETLTRPLREGEREREREQDMAWWSLMFYWTDTNYFGPGLHCLVEVSEKASQGMPWALCGDERGAVCVIEGLTLTATLVLVIYLFSEENNTMRNCERNSGWKAWRACEQLNRINTLQTRRPLISNTSFCCNIFSLFNLNSNHFLAFLVKCNCGKCINVGTVLFHGCVSFVRFLCIASTFSQYVPHRVQITCTMICSEVEGFTSTDHPAHFSHRLHIL